jgi:uncharacterized protein YecE (DUF72 family)
MLYGAPLPGPGDEHPERAAWPEDAPVRIGTSGWAYRHWLGRLYPRHLSSAKQLAHFARRFPAVEVNSTYYRLPGASVFRAWREAVPPGFRFAVKAPGSITHDKRLADVEAETEDLLERAALLGDRLGPLLFQFPPGFHADVKRLRAFLDLLPDGGTYAFELRHRSWYERDVRQMLARKGVAWVVHDFNQKGSPVWATADWTYLRLHGPSGRYRGAYDALALLAWSQQALQWLKEGRQVWCFFNNDERGHSVRNAVALRGLLEECLPEERVDLGVPERQRAGAGTYA